MPSNFLFLQQEWHELYEAATKAETFVLPDPRSACFYARRGLELAVQWLYTHDATLKLPYQDHLSALIHEPTFRDAVGPAVFAKAKLIKDLGNLAVHSHKTVRQEDALVAVKELFHIFFWLARTYGQGTRPIDDLVFSNEQLPRTVFTQRKTIIQLQALASEAKENDAKLSVLLDDKAALDAELLKLRAELAATKLQNAATPDTHDYSEDETRNFFIDLLLHEAGWTLDQPRDREYPVTGMPNSQHTGFVDYVLWGDDGLPLAVVEAKRTQRGPTAGQQQAKLYADCLEKQFGRRPVIFYSNGYEHWLWDDAMYPPRQVQGFYNNDELALLLQRRTTRKPLISAFINPQIVERFYQIRAIRRISEGFEKDHDRKALLVMATGAGKTRTVIALCDLLMRCNWAKRVLFLADRTALVNQAVGAFKRHLPDVSPVNLVTEREEEGRVFVSTYQTMMGLIDETRDGQRRFGVGYFDLVIIDEAHRSVYQKYRAIFDYFDSLLVGLTATPREEIDRNTYSLFDLESGVPTDTYGLEEAVRDGYLVPARPISVPLKFVRDGVRYDDLSEEEKDEWDAKEWSEDGEVPDRVEAAAVNKWLFNTDTVDKVLTHLMIRGLAVAGGDRLGKTIIFAKNHAHAEFIAQRFNSNYPHYKGEFARVIDFKVEYAQSLIDAFRIPNKAPHIAISVDMLDTGIDVPEVVNLVFFKLVRSKTKFWQMVGRGTRLCPDLFAPNVNKEFFYLFDYCQNLEYFGQADVPTSIGTLAESLGKQLFKARLELISELDTKAGKSPGAGIEIGDNTSPTDEMVRQETAETLRAEVAAMNIDNFVVRPNRRLVEKYTQVEAWSSLTAECYTDLIREVAGLPSELPDDDEEAKRFDLLLLSLQLSLLHAGASFLRLHDQVRSITGLLEDKSAIPMVQEQLVLIQEIQTDEWWQDVTVPMLEKVRKRMRELVKFIEKRQRKPIYTNFTDDMGYETAVELPGFTAADNFEKFRAKARQFLKAHENKIFIRKLRMNEPLTADDFDALEQFLLDNYIGTQTDIDRAKQESHGIGLFVRSLIGLDREAAKMALNTFISGKTLTANQIEFINLIIEHLVEHGVMDVRLLYESPYVDFNPQGVEGVFAGDEIDQLFAILADIGERAMSIAA